MHKAESLKNECVDFWHRQMNMDYSFCQAIKYGHMEGITRVISLYDVNCQYSKKFWRRVAENPYLTVPEDIQIYWGIGLFHVHGHQDSCLSRYAPTFLEGAGRVDGEIVETLWPGVNEISPSTRGATLAYRSELLNAHMNDSNLKKLVQMGEPFVVSVFKSHNSLRIQYSPCARSMTRHGMALVNVSRYLKLLQSRLSPKKWRNGKYRRNVPMRIG